MNDKSILIDSEVLLPESITSQKGLLLVIEASQFGTFYEYSDSLIKALEDNNVPYTVLNRMDEDRDGI